MRYLAFIGMADTKTVKFQVYLPEELRTRFKAKCVVSGTTMNETAVKLIEAWADKDELPGSESTNNASSDNQTQQPAPETPPQRRAKRMSGAGFMVLAISRQVQENYYKLLSSNKIEHERLKALASGDKPTEKERQIIKEVVADNG